MPKSSWQKVERKLKLRGVKVTLQFARLPLQVPPNAELLVVPMAPSFPLTSYDIPTTDNSHPARSYNYHVPISGLLLKAILSPSGALKLSPTLFQT